MVGRSAGLPEPGVASDILAAYGLAPYSNPADNLLLGDALSNTAVIQRLGNLTPYSGYATTNTLLNALRPYPQFSTIAVQNSPTGRTFYDSLQMKGTKRLSHGLQVNGTFTWSKAMVGIRPILFEPSEQVASAHRPAVPVQRQYCVHDSEMVQQQVRDDVVRDWGIGAFLQYGSGLPLAPPAATTTNYLGAFPLEAANSSAFRASPSFSRT